MASQSQPTRLPLAIRFVTSKGVIVLGCAFAAWLALYVFLSGVWSFVQTVSGLF